MFFSVHLSVDMTVHTQAFLPVGGHSRNRLYVHTSSGSGTQQCMASSWVTVVKSKSLT